MVPEKVSPGPRLTRTTAAVCGIYSRCHLEDRRVGSRKRCWRGESSRVGNVSQKARMTSGITACAMAGLAAAVTGSAVAGHLAQHLAGRGICIHRTMPYGESETLQSEKNDSTASPIVRIASWDDSSNTPILRGIFYIDRAGNAGMSILRRMIPLSFQPGVGSPMRRFLTPLVLFAVGPTCGG